MRRTHRLNQAAAEQLDLVRQVSLVQRQHAPRVAHDARVRGPRAATHVDDARLGLSGGSSAEQIEQVTPLSSLCYLGSWLFAASVCWSMPLGTTSRPQTNLKHLQEHDEEAPHALLVTKFGCSCSSHYNWSPP